VAEARNVVQVEVDGTEAELAADALWQAEPSAVLEVALAAGRVRLTADVAHPERIDARWSPRRLEVDDDGYLDAWRTWAQPVRAGRRTLLVPAWRDEPEEPDRDVVVVLDPGRSFGSGSHESTRLAIAALEAQVRPGDRVLDVGCGSGVLSIVAVRLGAAAAHGIDLEAEAIPTTLANAARNGVAGRVTAAATPLEEVAGAADLVVANIGGAVLFDLAGGLVAHVGPGGRVVLAGILVERVDALVAAMAPLVEVARAAEAGWGSVSLVASG
jgi:ribosomal protein L11 methyltransferase